MKNQSMALVIQFQLASANLTMCLKNKVKEVWLLKFAPDAQNHSVVAPISPVITMTHSTNHSQQNFTLDEQFDALFLFCQYLSNRDFNKLLQSI